MHFVQKNGDACSPYLTTGTDPDYLYMDGQEVFKFAVKKVPACIESLLAQSEIPASDVKYYLLHQANYRIITSIARTAFIRHAGITG